MITIYNLGQGISRQVKSPPLFNVEKKRNIYKRYTFMTHTKNSRPLSPFISTKPKTRKIIFLIF